MYWRRWKPNWPRVSERSVRAFAADMAIADERQALFDWVEDTGAAAS